MKITLESNNTSNVSERLKGIRESKRTPYLELDHDLVASFDKVVSNALQCQIYFNVVDDFINEYQLDFGSIGFHGDPVVLNKTQVLKVRLEGPNRTKVDIAIGVGDKPSVELLRERLQEGFIHEVRTLALMQLYNGEWISGESDSISHLKLLKRMESDVRYFIDAQSDYNSEFKSLDDLLGILILAAEANVRTYTKEVNDVNHPHRREMYSILKSMKRQLSHLLKARRELDLYDVNRELFDYIDSLDIQHVDAAIDNIINQ